MSVFTDKRVFQVEYVPEKILHREKQIERIEYLLSDLDRNARPRNLLCIGDFGTGKTAVVRFKCRNLPVGVVASYVNCTEQNTENRVIRSILGDLGVEVKLGFPSDYYLKLFKESVARVPWLILVLDEVDKLVERKDSGYAELFYTLSRSVNNVVAILLTNRVSFEATLLSSLDSRVRDTFRFERVEFTDYDAIELGSILLDRCRTGLNCNAYDMGIVNLISGVAFRKGMRARGVIDLTRKAGEIAESLRHETITEEDVRKAGVELSHDREMEIIRHLPPPHRAILGYVLHHSPASNACYDWWHRYAANYGFGTSRGAFHGYLKELETMDLVKADKHGLGRGRGLEMRLTVPPEIVSIVTNSLSSDNTIASITKKPTTPTPSLNM